MIAAYAAALALAVGGCHAPECLVQLGPQAAAPTGALQLEARRAPGLLTVELSHPALLVLRARGREVDRWLAPGGPSVHPLAPARRGVLRLVAVDGSGHEAVRVLPALRRGRPA
jgi:hypothetical protein